MRRGTQKVRESERLRKHLQAGVSSEVHLSDPDITDPERQPMVDLTPGRVETDARLGRTPLSSDQEPELELDDSLQEEEDIMTRLRYKRFKGDGGQDANDCLCEFESTVLTN